MAIEIFQRHESKVSLLHMHEAREVMSENTENWIQDPESNANLSNIDHARHYKKLQSGFKE